jgi:hypothetical protein
VLIEFYFSFFELHQSQPNISGNQQMPTVNNFEPPISSFPVPLLWLSERNVQSGLSSSTCPWWGRNCTGLYTGILLVTEKGSWFSFARLAIESWQNHFLGLERKGPPEGYIIDMVPTDGRTDGRTSLLRDWWTREVSESRNNLGITCVYWLTDFNHSLKSKASQWNVNFCRLFWSLTWSVSSHEYH